MVGPLSYVEVYRTTQAQEAGWATGAEVSRTRLYAGPARPLPLRRDWERMSAAEGRIAGIIRLVCPDDLMDASVVVVDGQEYRVVGVIRQGRATWEIAYRRWSDA